MKVAYGYLGNKKIIEVSIYTESKHIQIHYFGRTIPPFNDFCEYDGDYMNFLKKCSKSDDLIFKEIQLMEVEEK